MPEPIANQPAGPPVGRRGDDFTMTVEIARPPAEAFEALLDVRGWWSTGVSGATRELGDEFVFEVDGVHRSTMRLSEVEPGRTLVWDVSDAWLSFVEQTDEWDGTRCRFDLRPTDAGTAITFTHLGLTPAVECYDACTAGWTHYVGDSLRRLADEGAGDPHVPEAGVKDFERAVLAEHGVQA